MNLQHKPLPFEPAVTCIDLFAGAGGFSLGASNLGLKLLCAVDQDPMACKTYHRNFVEGCTNPPLLIEGDLREINPKSMMRELGISPGGCHILLGGPPCQGFSTHRIKDAGVDDPRNKLLLRYFEFVKALRPQAFLVENVPGLLWPRHASYLKAFYDCGQELGYELFPPQVLDARSFGVPQSRRRVFILGARKKIDSLVQWPPIPTHGDPASEEVRNGSKLPWKAAWEAFQNSSWVGDPNDIHMQHGAELIEVFRSTPKNGGSRSQSARVLPCHRDHTGHKDVYGRIDPSKPGPTMTTACINPSRGRFVHPTEDHGITARQAARIQTFPDGFIFEGGLMSMGVQIGNAVPPRLAEAVIAPVLEAVSLHLGLPVSCSKPTTSERYA